MKNSNLRASARFDVFGLINLRSRSFKQLVKTVLLVCLFICLAYTHIVLADTFPSQHIEQPTESDEKQMIPLWKRSFDEIKAKAENGDAYAQAVLADRYRTEIGLKNHLALSLKWSELSTKNDEPIGMFNLGILYIKGQGVKKNSELALQLFSKAFIGIVKRALNHDALAQKYFGMMYQNDIEVKKNGKKAIKWYQLAAIQGHAEAQKNLGTIYIKGNLVKKDYNQALKWLKSAAINNDPMAQSNLGLMYLNGYGTKVDYIKAKKWLKKSASQNYPVGQNNLGALFLKGEGVVKNYDKALSLFLLSASKEYIPAYINISIMYEMGWGVEKNCHLAIKWLSNAYKKGNDEAAKKLQRLQSNCK